MEPINREFSLVRKEAGDTGKPVRLGVGERLERGMWQRQRHFRAEMSNSDARSGTGGWWVRREDNRLAYLCRKMILLTYVRLPRSQPSSVARSPTLRISFPLKALRQSSQ